MMTEGVQSSRDASRTSRPVVVVIGGSEGIGFEIARRFAALGREVVLVARRPSALDMAVEKITQIEGGACQSIALDVSAPGCGAALLDMLAARGLHADVLVNSAATGVAGPFADNAAERIAATINLNIAALTELSRAVLPGMIARRSGGILNLASLAGFIPAPNVAMYCATKAYVIALTRSLAEETREYGVSVSAVVPGPVATAFLGRSLDVQRGIVGYIPALSADAVARVAVEAFLARQVIATPGILSALCRFGLKILPHRAVMWIVRPAITAQFWKTDGDGPA